MFNFLAGVVCVVGLYIAFPYLKSSARRYVMAQWDLFLNEVSTLVAKELRKRGDL